MWQVELKNFWEALSQWKEVYVFFNPSHRRFDLDVAETAGITIQLDDDLGDLQLGKLSQEYISDPDLCDILARTTLDTNKMSRLENEHLLLITSVIYSERFEIQGDRQRKVFILFTYSIK